ncbi:MAG: hypothetical protein HPY89_01285 [Pelotomaculum sp.]|nr:hypothetical protein [Pelotomaculum sp.]
MAVLLASVAAALLFYRFFFDIQLKSYNQTRAEIKKAAEQLRLMENELALAEDYAKELKAAKDREAFLNRYLAGPAGNGEIILKIGTAASGSEIQVTGFKPMEAAHMGQLRQELFLLKVRGDYKNFVRFLEDLENTSFFRGLSFKEIKISKAGAGPGSPEGTVEAEMIIAWCTVKPAAEYAPSGEAGARKAERKNPFEEVEYISFSNSIDGERG